MDALLAWYRSHARDLPWRRTADPYAIWISEIMLQQTQVKTVIPYWDRWMAALPTIGSLSRARTGRVLKLWEGLGYYSRARNIQKAAKVIVEQHGGAFPRTLAEIIELAGIGPYTAGAICSIAFDQPAPILDGNVIRALARLFAIHSDPKSSVANRRLWQLAEALVQTADRTRLNGERACSDLNQALMELGALICTPAEPLCAECPVQKYCLAFSRRCVHRLPVRRAQRPPVQRRFTALVLQHKGRFLVRRRSAELVNGSLWEFPNVEVSLRRKTPLPMNRLVRSSPGKVVQLCTIRHTITRYRITLEVFEAHLNGSVRAELGKWRTVEQLQRLAFSSAHKQIVAKLQSRKTMSGRRLTRPKTLDMVDSQSQ